MILFPLIIFVVLIIPLAHADDKWNAVSVFDHVNNNTQYIFYYYAENSTFTLIEPPELGYHFPSFIFDTSENVDGYLKFKAPKNYPFHSTSSPFLALMSDYKEMNYALEWDDSDAEYGSNDCFYEIKLFVGNLTKVEFTSPIPPVVNLTFESQNIPEKCLLQTIAGYSPFSDDDWKIYKLNGNFSNLDDSYVFNIPYNLHAGQIDAIQIDQKTMSFLIVLKNSTGNYLNILIPRNLLDAKLAIEMDRSFSVLVDGVKIDYIKATNHCYHNMLIPIDVDSKLIEIMYNNTNFDILNKSKIQPLYIETLKDRYSSNETIMMKGCVSLNSEGDDVSVSVLDHNGKVYHSTLVQPNQDGTFSSSFVIGDALATDVQHTVKVEYGGHTTMRVFTVPEFPIATLVLFIAIISIILFSRKTHCGHHGQISVPASLN